MPGAEKALVAFLPLYPDPSRTNNFEAVMTASAKERYLAGVEKALVIRALAL